MHDDDMSAEIESAEPKQSLFRGMLANEPKPITTLIFFIFLAYCIVSGVIENGFVILMYVGLGTLAGVAIYSWISYEVIKRVEKIAKEHFAEYHDGE